MLLGAVAACSSSSNRQTEAWAERWIAALNSRDIERVTALLDADATYEESLTPAPISGPPLRYFFTTLLRAPDQRFTLQAAVRDADHIAVEWRSTRTYDGGKTLTIDGVFVIRLRAERAAHIRSYYDANAYLPLLASG